MLQGNFVLQWVSFCTAMLIFLIFPFFNVNLLPKQLLSSCLIKRETPLGHPTNLSATYCH